MKERKGVDLDGRPGVEEGETGRSKGRGTVIRISYMRKLSTFSKIGKKI